MSVDNGSLSASLRVPPECSTAKWMAVQTMCGFVLFTNLKEKPKRLFDLQPNRVRRFSACLQTRLAFPFCWRSMMRIHSTGTLPDTRPFALTYFTCKPAPAAVRLSFAGTCCFDRLLSARIELFKVFRQAHSVLPKIFSAPD